MPAQKKYTAQVKTEIAAPREDVWAALTDPALIKQYLYGVNLITDWKVGSPIVYRGVWQGKSFEDRGRVLEVERFKKLKASYWSELSKYPDRPENYQNVTYELTPDGDSTVLTITHDNIADDDSRKYAENNWLRVMAGIKALVEHPDSAEIHHS